MSNAKQTYWVALAAVVLLYALSRTNKGQEVVANVTDTIASGVIGCRLNNPLNIECGDDLEGLADVQENARFFHFISMPPYWQTEGYGMPFDLPEYTRLADAMRTMKGKAVLSVNDHPDMQQAFKGLRTKRVSLVYSVGRKGRTPRGELIIRNW